MRAIWVWLVGAVCAAFCGVASPASAATWLQATTPRFSVYSSGSEAVLRDYAEKLEVFDAAFWQVWGLERPPPLRRLPIFLVPRPADLRQVSPGLADGVGGFYTATANIVFAMALSGDEYDDIVLHEYAHHLMMQQFAYGYPGWLIEGYAEYFMSSKLDRSVVQIGLPTERAPVLGREAWVPLDEVLTKRPEDISPAQRSVYYAESWLLTHYLLSDSERSKALSAYLSALSAGKPSVAAMTEAIGMAPPVLERRLRAYVAGQMRYTQFPRSAFEKPAVTIRKLSPGEGDLLLDDVLIKTGGVPKGQEQATLTRIRAKAAPYPDEPLVQRVLARTEHYYGDKTVAETILKKRLAADPRDVDAIAIYADLLMDLGDETPAKRVDYYNQAGSMLAASFKLDPTNFATLNDFVHSRVIEANFPSDNTVTAMLAAVKLAPQVIDVRLSAAQGLMRRKNYRQATIVLTPLTNNPHSPAAAKAAQKILSEIPADAAR